MKDASVGPAESEYRVERPVIQTLIHSDESCTLGDCAARVIFDVDESPHGWHVEVLNAVLHQNVRRLGRVTAPRVVDVEVPANFRCPRR